MFAFKGTMIVSIRHMLEKGGEKTLANALEKLPATLRSAFLRALPISKFTGEDSELIMNTAADILFPGDNKGVYLLGKACAEDNFKGIYGFLLSAVTVKAIVFMATKVWRLYMDKGDASITLFDEERKIVEMTVANIPEFSLTHRIFVSGFCIGILGFSGAKELRIVKIDNDPNAWKWQASYK